MLGSPMTIVLLPAMKLAELTHAVVKVAMLPATEAMMQLVRPVPVTFKPVSPQVAAQFGLELAKPVLNLAAGTVILFVAVDVAAESTTWRVVVDSILPPIVHVPAAPELSEADE